VDKEALIDILANVSDFESAVAGLNPKKKGLYQTLKNLGETGSTMNK
jgi:hypothetical protein